MYIIYAWADGFGWALDKQLLYGKDIYIPDSWALRAQPEIHGQSAKLFLQSSELRLPTPSPAGECPPSPLVPGEGDTLTAGEGVGGPNSDEETDTVVL
jgi:hypothetical protein